MVLTSPENVVSNILYFTVTLTFALLIPNCDALICPMMHSWCKFGENVSNTLQDIAVVAHTDARTDGRTGQKHYASGHTTLG